VGAVREQSDVGSCAARAGVQSAAELELELKLVRLVRMVRYTTGVGARLGVDATGNGVQAACG
jgi:hypothetical protein